MRFLDTNDPSQLASPRPESDRRSTFESFSDPEPAGSICDEVVICGRDDDQRFQVGVADDPELRIDFVDFAEDQAAKLAEALDLGKLQKIELDGPNHRALLEPREESWVWAMTSDRRFTYSEIQDDIDLTLLTLELVADDHGSSSSLSLDDVDLQTA